MCVDVCMCIWNFWMKIDRDGDRCSLAVVVLVQHPGRGHDILHDHKYWRMNIMKTFRQFLF